jgi:hypothetical protein
MCSMKFLKIFIIILVLGFYTPKLIYSNDFAFKWRIGEELTYKVKWAFIRLGTLKLEVADTTFVDDKLIYHVKLHVDSNPMLFFVNMHNVYNSFINENFQLHHFYAKEVIDDLTYKAEYKIDYGDSLILINMTDVDDTTKNIKRSMPFERTILDGTSLVFYARKQAVTTKKDTVESFFESERGRVAFNFHGRKDLVTIAALDSPIECFYIDGKIHTKGIAGITGPYKGWFAADGQRPPIKAELKVFIGSVKVELEKWKKWEPKY